MSRKLIYWVYKWVAKSCKQTKTYTTEAGHKYTHRILLIIIIIVLSILNRKSGINKTVMYKIQYERKIIK